MPKTHLGGVYAAALTPLKPDFAPDLEAIPLLLDFLSRRGCHGALLLGTTGEGPSFAPEERIAVCRAALDVRQAHPEFRLLAGTGTPSLEETSQLTRAVFDMGFNGVVVLPPYYFRNAEEEGLFAWFQGVIQKSVPDDGALFGYHIPQVSGVPLSPDLLARLSDAFPNQFAGLKDSTGDLDHARMLGDRFGEQLTILNGNDRLLTQALEAGAAGCITAMANLCSPDLRQVWDAAQDGNRAPEAQARLSNARAVLDRHPPAAPFLKALLPRLHDFPRWTVRPPLMPLTEDTELQAWKDWQEQEKR